MQTPQTQVVSSAVLLRVALLAAAAMVMTGCVSPGGYFKDRSRDAADIFTVSLGKGHGAKARVGPAQLGLFFNRDYAGLRGGESHRCWNDETGLPSTFDFNLLLVSGERFDPDRFETGRKRNKCFVASGVFFFTVSRRFEGEDWSAGDLSYYTQVEVALGLFRTIRVGFNVGELFDFLIGLTTLDIFSDDLRKP